MYKKALLVFGLLAVFTAGSLFGQWWGMSVVNPSSAIPGHQVFGKNPSGWFQSYIPLSLLEVTPEGNIWYAIPMGGNLTQYGANVQVILQIGDPVPNPQ